MICNLHDGHDAPGGLGDGFQRQTALAIGRGFEKVGELGQLALLAVEGLDHGQVAHAQQRFLDRADGAGEREHRVHDDEARPGVCFEGVEVPLEDGEGVGRGPVVENHAQEVDVGARVRLRAEEVVALGPDS